MARQPATSTARTAAENVAEDIRAQIATGRLNPGDRLPTETSLLAHYDVARSTMREALRILESDGLVVVERGTKGGARVQEATVAPLARRIGLHLQLRGADLVHLIDAQAVIQPGAIALAAKARTKHDVARLRASVAWVAAAGSMEDFVEAVRSFTDALLAATHNPVIALFWELTAELWVEGTQAFIQDAGMTERVDDIVTETATAFGALVDLVETGDADGAETMSRSFLRDSSRFHSDDSSPLHVYPVGTRRRRLTPVD